MVIISEWEPWGHGRARRVLREAAGGGGWEPESRVLLAGLSGVLTKGKEGIRGWVPYGGGAEELETRGRRGWEAEGEGVLCSVITRSSQGGLCISRLQGVLQIWRP